jgi:methionyl-tRNA synthetase
LVTPNSQSDINFDWDDFADRINNDLIDNIGNFVNRSLSFICKTYEGKVPAPGKFETIDEAAIIEIKKISEQVGGFLHRSETEKGLKRILEFSKYFNQYFQKKQPWKNQETRMSSADTINSANANNMITDGNATTLFVAVNAVSSLAILLEPFIPFSSEKIWCQLGMGLSDIHKQRWSHASNPEIQPGHPIINIKPIFRKVDIKELQIEKARFNQQRD